jgi:hypothetical protein
MIASHRFLLQGPSTTGSYVVPANYTAAVRGIALYNYDVATTLHSWWLQLNGFYIAGGQEGGDQSGTTVSVSRSIDIRVVANAGDTLTFFTGAQMYGAVSGFLFTT